jgi:hypothetical protein
MFSISLAFSLLAPPAHSCSPTPSQICSCKKSEKTSASPSGVTLAETLPLLVCVNAKLGLGLALRAGLMLCEDEKSEEEEEE